MATAAQNRRWRRKLRAELLALFGNFCWGPGCGANGDTKLEFAHRFPVRRDAYDRRKNWDGTDERLREVRRNPFRFILLCRGCHHHADGPYWLGPRIRLTAGRVPRGYYSSRDPEGPGEA